MSWLAILAVVLGLIWVLALLLAWCLMRMAAISDRRDEQAIEQEFRR